MPLILKVLKAEWTLNICVSTYLLMLFSLVLCHKHWTLKLSNLWFFRRSGPVYSFNATMLICLNKRQYLYHCTYFISLDVQKIATYLNLGIAWIISYFMHSKSVICPCLNIFYDSQVISTARACNVILIVLDAIKPITHKCLIEKELEGFGIR
jgi:hypothetical protein